MAGTSPAMTRPEPSLSNLIAPKRAKQRRSSSTEWREPTSSALAMMMVVMAAVMVMMPVMMVRQNMHDLRRQHVMMMAVMMMPAVVSVVMMIVLHGLQTGIAGRRRWRQRRSLRCTGCKGDAERKRAKPGKQSLHGFSVSS